jgi:hypothetical protein
MTSEYKGGLDGDNSCLIFLFNFRKRKLFIFQLHFMQLFVAGAKMFLKKITIFFWPPKHKKNSPKKLLIIPLDHQFSVQQVFAFRNWDSFEVWNFLISEVFKLCRMKKYLYDAGTIAFHYVVLNYLYSAWHL